MTAIDVADLRGTLHESDCPALMQWGSNGITEPCTCAGPAVLDALDAIRALHPERRYGNTEQTVCDRCDEPWPCATMRALDVTAVTR